MDAFYLLGDLFEWLQDAMEKRWGKFWAWTIVTVALLLLVGGSIWLVSRR
jgi:hypothetical protein